MPLPIQLQDPISATKNFNSDIHRVAVDCAKKLSVYSATDDGPLSVIKQAIAESNDLYRYLLKAVGQLK